MYEDDTIRLFGVANILKNRKDKNDNWERDDIPDIKEQPLTGKYDHNFDALGSDFQRAHQYNFNNYKGEQRIGKIARNLVDFEAGKTILQTAFNCYKNTSTQIELFNYATELVS
jgi:hypothetical protein